MNDLKVLYKAEQATKHSKEKTNTPCVDEPVIDESASEILKSEDNKD